MEKPKMSPTECAAMAGHHAYMEIAGNMNRAERRTAHGKLVVAQARIAQLEAENNALKLHLETEQYANP
ncbi:hypothetical protein HA052_23230 [Chromobacterium haemolyticum]|uniref:Transposase n=1 Tax=Chromobacterium fluminis TaxID=3044269 RepID=A0ABX0LAM3_9NEIS|nr:hypothetical protein [Chromobacterium haemolyticum]NHR08108.1 hypothetical protein [Chromobacterium haemolyticum]